MFKKGNVGGMFKKHSLSASNRLIAPHHDVEMKPYSFIQQEMKEKKEKPNSLEKMHK